MKKINKFVRHFYDYLFIINFSLLPLRVSNSPPPLTFSSPYNIYMFLMPIFFLFISTYERDIALSATSEKSDSFVPVWSNRFMVIFILLSVSVLFHLFYFPPFPSRCLLWRVFSFFAFAILEMLAAYFT